MVRYSFSGLLAATAMVGLLAACQPPPQQASAPPAPQQAAPPVANMAYPIYFDSGSAVIHGNDQDTIRGVASMLAGNPALTATIVGVTDTVGTADYNAKLSQRRAQAVFNAMVNTHKIPQDRVAMRWVGEGQLPVPTADNKPELLNRTVYIILR